MAFRGVGMVALCLEAFKSDDEKGVNLANLIVASDEAARWRLVDPSVVC
jgi:hypothetical protein